MPTEEGPTILTVRSHLPQRETPAEGLPDEHRQLAEMAASYAVVFVVAWVTMKLGSSPPMSPEGLTFGLPELVAAVAVLVSLLLTIIPRFRSITPEQLRNFSPAYLLFGAAGIAVTELWRPLPADALVVGVSWNCLWIVAYPFVAPFPHPQPRAPALLAASIGPAVLAAAVTAGVRPLPEVGGLALLLVPPYIAALISIAPTKRLLRLRGNPLLGSYKLVELLGRGGMGEVWRGEHKLLARPAAIKLVHPDAVRARHRGSLIAERLRREAKATSELRSPHTVELYDFGVTDDGRYYFVMELLDGMDMDSLVERFGPVEPVRACHFLRQACLSLAEAHEVGLTHRDIKPANLFVCRVGLEVDFVKVLDFGLVKREGGFAELEGGSVRLTMDGFSGGTPAFMAPEMILAEKVDHRADIYCLGCVGYWLLTGRLVFPRRSVPQMIMDHVNTPPAPPSRLSEYSVPAALDSLLLSCLEKRPEDRPQSALEVMRRLNACQFDQPWDTLRASVWWRAHLPQNSPTGPLPLLGDVETLATEPLP